MKIRHLAAVILAIAAFLVMGPALARADTLVARANAKGTIAPYPGGSISVNVAVSRYASGLVIGTINLSGVDEPIALIVSNAKATSLDFDTAGAIIRTAPTYYSDLRGWVPGSGATLPRTWVTCVVTITSSTVGFQIIDVADGAVLQQVPPIALRPGGTISLLNRLPSQ